MNPESLILLMICAWLLLAAALLWGMLRVARRHQRDAWEQHQRKSLPANTEAKRPAVPKPQRPWRKMIPTLYHRLARHPQH